MFYTRRGDKGTSGLFGTEEKFPKDSPVFSALGAVDELNSLLGVCRAKAGTDEKRAAPRLRPGSGRSSQLDIAGEILKSQETLFIIQAEIAGADKSVKQETLDILEEAIDAIEGSVKNPNAFVFSGATELSALCDYARSVCRRAEREAISYAKVGKISQTSLSYLNRLSSLLYALARLLAEEGGEEEKSPSY